MMSVFLCGLSGYRVSGRLWGGGKGSTWCFIRVVVGQIESIDKTRYERHRVVSYI